MITYIIRDPIYLRTVVRGGESVTSCFRLHRLGFPRCLAVYWQALTTSHYYDFCRFWRLVYDARSTALHYTLSTRYACVLRTTSLSTPVLSPMTSKSCRIQTTSYSWPFGWSWGYVMVQVDLVYELPVRQINSYHEITSTPTEWPSLVKLVKFFFLSPPNVFSLANNDF